MKSQGIEKLFTNSTKVILASNSKTRKKILQASNIKFDIRPHKVNEEKIKRKDQTKPPESIVFEIAKVARNVFIMMEGLLGGCVRGSFGEKRSH